MFEIASETRTVLTLSRVNSILGEGRGRPKGIILGEGKTEGDVRKTFKTPARPFRKAFIKDVNNSVKASKIC